MKNLIILLILSSTILISCSVSSVKYPFRSNSYELIDFSRYGDFIMQESNVVPIGYKSIFVLMSTASSGWELTDKTKIEKNYEGNEYTSYVYSDKYIQATPEIVLDKLYEKAKEKKANGLINIEIRRITEHEYEAKGTAIVREK